MSINNLNTYLNVRDAHLRVVSGNVYAQAMNIGGINVETAHGLQSVSNTGNATSLTLEFANVTTGFVTTANAQIGRDLVVTGNATVSKELTVTSNAIVSSNLNVSDDLIVTNNILASNNLTVTGNLNVTTIMSDSNVVAEYTGPHDRPLRKYPEVALTANDNSSTSGYVADQSSTNGFGDGLAYRLFDHSSTTAYQSGGAFSGGIATGSNPITTASDESTHQGVAITLDLATKIRLSYAKITSHTYYGRTPANGSFLGSNNNSTWDVIGTFSGLSTTAAGQTYTVHIADYATKSAYRYIRLVVTRTSDSLNLLNGGTLLEFRELEYYGHEEGSGSLDTTLKSVYNVPATTGTQLEVYYDGQDYTSGTTVNDLSPNTNNGTLGSGIGFDSTYKAFTFDGTANGKIVGTHPLSGTSPVLTMSFWVKRTAVVGTGWNYVATIGTSTTGQMIGLTINPSSQFNFSNYGDGILTAEPILLNQWYHVTLVTNGEAAFNSTNFKMYINGKEPVLSSHGGGNTTTLTGTQLTLGTNTNSAEAFNGSIANFRLYSKALNADQVKELYDYQKDYFLGSKSQVTLYKGHLGVGVTEPSGQLELAGDERIQEYPPGPMDDYETLIPGHGVFCAYGEVPTDSIYLAGWPWWKVFDGDQNTAFHGKDRNYDSTTPFAFNGQTHDVRTKIIGGTEIRGEFIDLKCPYEIVVTSMIMNPRGGLTYNTYLTRMPSQCIFVGSNDGTEYEIISSHSGIVYSGTAPYSANLTINATKPYKHIRLIITHLGGNGSDNGGVVNMGHLRYFGTPGPTTLDKGSLTLGRSLDVPRVSRYDVDTETPRPEKLVVDFDTTVNSSPTDISGKGNHGTFYNGAFYSAPDKAFVFDGTDDYIEATTNLGSGNQNVSFSMWINTHTAPRWFTWLGSEATGGGMGMYRSSSTYKIVVRNGGNLEISAGPLNTWEHLVFIYDSSTGAFKGYVNGESGNVTGSFIDTVDVFSLAANPPIEIGARTTAGSDPYFDGQISNFKLYNTVLEPSEVRKLYNLGRTGRSMVISDTAVGIGKAPEAQLDVRGDLRVGGRLLASVPYYSARQRDTQSYVFDESIVYDQYVYTNYPGSFVANSATDGYYKPPMNGMYQVHMECIASGSGNIHIQRLTNGTVDISHDDRHFNYPHSGWMSISADALIPITNHTTQTIRIYHNGSTGNGLWQYATYHGSAFFLWVSDIPERRQHHVA